MTSFIAAGGSGRSISVIPAVPAAWSVSANASKTKPACPCVHTIRNQDLIVPF
jgi:hypothetical protein